MNIKMLRKYSFLLFVCILIAGCCSSPSVPPVKSNAKNIILFIGDGMGREHIKAARWVTLGEDGLLSVDNMPTSGWSRTRSANSPVTDSAAAATAMATGVKTNNGFISLDANLNLVSTILEKAKGQEKAVGLVTTGQITPATPAAFASHVKDRNSMTEIAVQMFITGVDVLLGGGEDEFLPVSDTGCYQEPGKRDDGRNLIEEAISSGYIYVCDSVSLESVGPSSTHKLLGLFADEGMTRPFSPSLAGMTQKAIDILSNSPNGFFLMVEGGQIDWASHANDAANTIGDTVGFFEAVGVAIEYVSLRDDTLIIVTADHETGGMTISSTSTGLPDEDGPFNMPDGRQFYVTWSTTGHTAADVPVASQGPFSDMLAGVYENTFIYDVMLNALYGLDNAHTNR